MFQKIQELMQADLHQVDGIIRNDLKSEVALINQISQYIIHAGGKRIRPLLVLLSARSISPQEIITPHQLSTLHHMAAMIEYIHTATLLHDDVVDESNIRRGQKTANALFGNASSILVGDFIYTRAFQMMTKSESMPILQIMADSTNKIAEGEILQLLNIGKTTITQDEYLQVIQYKTATLFAAAAHVAGIILNAPHDIHQALVTYTTNLGYAFQIVDDILDYTGDVSIMGKNIGDDLHEGKITLPIIYLLKNSRVEIKQIVIEAIQNPQHESIAQIIDIIKQSSAIADCNKQVLHYVNTAITILSKLPESIYKDALITLAQYNIQRIQ